MKIIFAGTPDIASYILTDLITQQYNIIACLTQPDRPKGRGQQLCPSPVKQVANAYHIDCLQPTTLKDPAIIKELTSLAPDLLIVVAYGLILPKTVLELPTYGAINLHASLLPRWRGAAPIQHAILQGDKQTGVCIMQMDEGLDTGPILATYPCLIAPDETSATLYGKLTQLGKEALRAVIPQIARRTLQAIPQPQEGVTYANKIEKHHAWVNWQQPAVVIDRQIRAYQPFPVAQTKIKNQVIRLHTAQVLSEENSTEAAGTILACNKTGIDVQTGQGILRLLQLQLPGKKKINAADHSNAHTKPFDVNDCFATI